MFCSKRNEHVGILLIGKQSKVVDSKSLICGIPAILIQKVAKSSPREKKNEDL